MSDKVGNYVRVNGDQTVNDKKTFTDTLTAKEGVGSGGTAQTAANCFVIDSDQTNAGMTIIAPTGGNSNIYFAVNAGSGKDAFVQHVASVSELRLGVDNSNDIRVRTSDILMGKPIQVYDAPGGNLLFQVESDGTVSVDTANYETLVTDDDDIPNKKYVDDSIAAQYPQVTSKTSGDSPYSAVDKDFILCDTTGGNITINLPAAASSTNAFVTIKKTVAANSVIIDGNASETIDGGLTATLNSQWELITVVCDGSNWFIGT